MGIIWDMGRNVFVIGCLATPAGRDVLSLVNPPLPILLIAVCLSRSPLKNLSPFNAGSRVTAVTLTKGDATPLRKRKSLLSSKACRCEMAAS